MCLAFIPHLAVGGIVSVESSHQCNRPNEQPKQRHKERSNAHQQNTEGTPHGTNGGMEIGAAQGYLVPLGHGVSKTHAKDGETTERYYLSGIRLNHQTKKAPA